MAKYQIVDEEGKLIGETQSPAMASQLLKAARDQRKHETKGRDEGKGIKVKGSLNPLIPISDMLNDHP